MACLSRERPPTITEEEGVIEIVAEGENGKIRIMGNIAFKVRREQPERAPVTRLVQFESG